MLAVVLIYSARLTYLHVFDSELKLEGARHSKGNITLYPPRGLVYGSDSSLVVSNQPAYRINLTYADLELGDTVAFCELIDIPIEELRKKLADAHSVRISDPKRVLKEYVTSEEFAGMVDRLYSYPGISHEAFTIRKYGTKNMAGVLGYIREVSEKDIAGSSGYYQLRDLKGKAGIELAYEEYLRGKKGVKYVMRNARRKIVGSLSGGDFDTLPEAGQNLMLSIDSELQRYAEALMLNKKGAIVAIEPETGEILAIVAAPSFDPTLLSGKTSDIGRNYLKLIRDENKPLYNRATQAPYPPGSTFKPAMAAVGLHLGSIDTISTRFSCIKSIVGCHNHAFPLRIGPAITTSCNPFFVQTLWKTVRKTKSEGGIEASKKALDIWQGQMNKLGLGQKLGIDLAYEASGRIPGSEYYNRKYAGREWAIGNIQSIGIGQGEVGVTPIQLANLASIISNRGWYIVPHVVKIVGNTGKPLEKYQVKHQSEIESEYFEYIVKAMRKVVIAGTAPQAHIPGVTICGKTGTAENPHGKDHSVFMAFAPQNTPKIAVSVYVENAGFGGSWAAPIASLIIEKYLNGEIMERRKYLEERVLNKDFIH